MNTLHYKVIYRNGDKIPVEIADFYRTDSGGFVFEYVDEPKYEFPGFDKSIKKYESDQLWEQISFRVPNNMRGQFPGTPLEELLQKTGGKLAADNFEFRLVNGK
ncbi:MAG: hypothetical protein AAB725_00040 [Patescibacteria group bacterium]